MSEEPVKETSEEPLQAKLQRMQLEMAEGVYASQMSVSRMNESEATFRAQAAKAVADRELATTKAAKTTHEKLIHQSNNMFRPTAMMRPEITRLDGEWQAGYGEVIGMGPSPELACQDFDRIWLGQEI